jgi:hypothetical protein
LPAQTYIPALLLSSRLHSPQVGILFSPSKHISRDFGFLMRNYFFMVEV